MSARDSSEAGPLRTVKREPVIFAARSKSRMPSAGPRSQCACGGKSKRVGSPHVFRTTFAVSSSPSGTSSCGMFGSVSSMGANRSSRAFESLLRRERICGRDLFRTPAVRRWSPRFALRFAPIFCEREFRSARAASTFVIASSPLDVDLAPLLERAGRHVALPQEMRQALEFLSKKISCEIMEPCILSGGPPVFKRALSSSGLTVPRVLVAIVSWNSAAHLRDAITSVPEGVPVVVVDNASSDGSAEVARDAGARVIEAGANLGFGPACNRAALEGRPVGDDPLPEPRRRARGRRADARRASRRARRGPRRRRRGAAARGRRPGPLSAPPPPVGSGARSRGAPRRPPLPGQRGPSPRPLPRRGPRARPSTSSSPPPPPSS